MPQAEGTHSQPHTSAGAANARATVNPDTRFASLLLGGGGSRFQNGNDTNGTNGERISQEQRAQGLKCEKLNGLP